MGAIGELQGRQQQAQQIAETIRRNKADEGLRQQQLTQAQSIADRAADLASNRLDLDKEVQRANLYSIAQGGVRNIQEALGAGHDPRDLEAEFNASLGQLMNYMSPNGPVVPHPGGLQAPPSPTNLQLPAGQQAQQQPQQQSSTPTPDQSPTGATGPQQPQSGIDPGITQRLQANKIAQIEAEAKARGVVTPAQTSQQTFQGQQARDQRDWEDKRQGAQNQFQIDQVNREQVFKAGESAKERTNRLDVAKMSKSAQIYGYNLEHDSQLNRTAAEFGVDPGDLSHMIVDWAGGGQKLDEKNPIMRKAMLAGEDLGYKDSGKDIDYISKLDQIQKNDLPAFTNFAQNYLSTNAAGQKLQSALAPTNIGKAGDAKKAEEMLKTRFQGIGTGLEGFSPGTRLASAFSAEGSSMPNLSDKQDQGLNKVANMDGMINQEKWYKLSNYTPQQLELFVGHNPGVDFTIKMKAPDGTIKAIPPQLVKSAIEKGAKVVQ